MSQERKGIILTIIGGIMWGICGVLGKYLFDVKELTAPWLVNIRLIFAGILLLIVVFIKDRGKVLDVWKRKESAFKIIIFGIFGMTCCQLTYFLAIQASNAGTATVLQYTAPVFIMMFYAILERRWPSLREMIVLGMVLAGTFLLATHGSLNSLTITTKALIWGGMAAVTLCVYNIQPRGLLAEFGSMPTIGWGMLLGGIVMAVIVRPWHVVGIWDTNTLLAVFAIVVFGTMISFSCYLEGVRLIGPVKASLFACVEPLVAMTLSVLVTGAPFTMMDLAGMLLILVGVGALSGSGKKDEKKETGCKSEVPTL